MKCNNCNNDLKEGSKFCGVCGAPVKQYQEQKKTQKIKESSNRNNTKIVFIGSISVIIIIVFSLVLFIIIAPSNKQDKLWDKIKNKNTIEAFDRYLAQYPDGKYNEDAINRRKKLEEGKKRIEEQQKKQLLKEKAEREKQNNLLKYYDIEDIGIIDDPDGYTNVREHNNINSKIILSVKENEEFKIIDKTGDWWKILTKDGIVGYMHKSRINNIKKKVQGRFPEASTHKLTEGQLSLWNSDELRLMRNEIFARYGYVFKSKDLKEYFNNQEWNRNIEKLTPSDDGTGILKDIEKANNKKIQEIEIRKRTAEENEAWQAAKKSNTSKSLINYLSKYPNGSHWQDANSMLISKNNAENIKLEIGLPPIEIAACKFRWPFELRNNEKLEYAIIYNYRTNPGIYIDVILKDSNHSILSKEKVEYRGHCQNGSFKDIIYLEKGKYILEINYKGCVIDRSEIIAL